MIAPVVTNIKINNETYVPGLFAVPVRITDPYPTISWTFFQDTLVVTSDPPGSIVSSTPIPQGSFVLKLNSDSTHWGDSLFSGAIIDTGTVTSNQQSWRLREVALVRGTTYYAQLTVKNTNGDQSVIYPFKLKFNSLPVASGAAISPSLPSVHSTLTLSYFYSDADGDTQGDSNIFWFRNGIHERKFDGLLQIASANLRYGDVWRAEVVPFDGHEYGNLVATSSVSVITTTPVVASLSIAPENPTVGDPLYAKYDYTASNNINKSIIKWYVNGAEVSGANTAFARLETVAGDVVHFEIQPNDDVSSGSFVASESVTILLIAYRVANVRVQNQSDPLAVAISTPTLSWEQYGPVPPTQTSILLGTAPMSSNVASYTLTNAVQNFTIPANVLHAGTDYYASIAIGDDTLGNYEIIHFRLAGSRWNLDVSNSTGWTIETDFSIEGGLSGIEYADIAEYHGIRIFDGTKAAEIRFYVDKIDLISAGTLSANADFTSSSIITVTGVGSNIKIYQNYELLIDGTGKLLQSTSDKYVEFGSLFGSMEGLYQNFYYTTAGAYAPGVAQYNHLDFSTFYDADGEIDYITAAGGTLYFAASDNNASSQVFKVTDNDSAIRAVGVSRAFLTVNRIVNVGRNTYVCHDQGATAIREYVVPLFDEDLELVSGDNPNDHLWRTYTSDTNRFLPSQVENHDGLMFLSHSFPGTPWFDRASNAKGWTVESTFRLISLTDDISLSNASQSKGCGIYVNDGTYREVIWFFESEIVFASSSKRVTFNTAVETKFRITGKGNSISLFANDVLLMTAPLTVMATNEGNAGRPSITEDASGHQHCVWHDDGTGFRQLYYSKGISATDASYATTRWQYPQPISSIPYGSSNGSVAVDSDGNVYVVYEQSRSDGSDIGIVVKTRFGWSEPYILSAGIAASNRPRIAIDTSDGVHVVWDDARNLIPQIYYAHRNAATGKWSSATAITSTAYGCLRPAIDTYGTDVFVSYTQKKSNGYSDIYAIANIAGVWQVAAGVYVGGKDADYSDLTTDSNTVYLTWHDTSNAGNYQIYARRMDHSFVAYEATKQLTATGEASIFPAIGRRAGVGGTANNVYIVWEDGGDISPFVSHGAYTGTAPNIRSAYYDYTAAHWLSDNQSFTQSSITYGGFDVKFVPPDLRSSSKPAIAKHFTTKAHVVCETQMASVLDEYVATSDVFVLVRDNVYDLTYAATYTIDEVTDLQVSAQLERKEIRFGDFSDSVNAFYYFNNFKYYTHDAVAPYSAALISSRTTSLVDNLCLDAAVNPSGDAWIGNSDGLMFFFRDSKELARLSESNTFGGLAVNCVTFDRNHVLFAGTNSALWVSYDHLTFAAVTFPSSVTTVPVFYGLVADGKNNLWAATSAGLWSLSTSKNLTLTSGAVPITLTTVTRFTTDKTTRVAIDDANVVWGATEDGLVRVSGGLVLRYRKESSGIPSNKVNDICIRNTGVRYVATDSGLVRMTSEFEKVLVNDQRWSDNVAAVAWQEPNIIWASSASDLFQLSVDDETGTYSPFVYTPEDYALTSPGDCDRPRIYRFVGLDSTKLIEVYVNGRKVKNGYVISTDENAIVFDSPLLGTDQVEVVIRNDIEPFASLAQNTAERMAYGSIVRNVKKLLTDGTKIYAAIEGDADQLAVYDTSDEFLLPYDKIGLDTTPPTGTLTFVRQITRKLVELAITNATDNLSGLDSMAISNYDNFTSDGTTPLTFQDFKDDFTFDLGFDLGNKSDQLTFSGMTGYRLTKFGDTFYAGTKSPANIYRYSNASNTWGLVTTLDADDTEASVEFISVYKNNLVIGTGSSSASGKVYVSSNGTAYTLLSSITGTHARCAAELNDVLYIGTSGSGLLYAYNGRSLASIRTSHATSAPLLQMGSSIYSLAAFDNRLYAGTGEQARVYRFDPITLVAQIIYLDVDTKITATGAILIDGTTADTQDLYVFAGTGATGKIVKSINGNPFVTSYAGLAAKVGMAKVFNDTMFVAVGNTLYRYNKSWIARVTHTEAIEDFYVGPDITVTTVGSTTAPPPRNDITIISAGKITKINGQISQKKVYLSLRDVAGNATRQPGTSAGEGTESTIIELDLDIDDLENFTNANRIIQLDETGTTTFAYDGDAPFYSANKVIEEQGVYESEIFNGTNDHVTWETIHWDADVPDGTDITISVRTSDFRSTIQFETFDKTFTKSKFAGADISNLGGKYIQFKAVLSTTTRGLTPKLYKVVIKSRTRASVHFFTTNFVLPSRVTKGLVTADIYKPIAADVLIGINTNDSVDFSDYQIIDPNRLFTLDPSQTGMNLRVGVKLIAPLPQSTFTDPITQSQPSFNPFLITQGMKGRFLITGGYGSSNSVSIEYSSISFYNVVDFSYTSPTAGTYDFKIEFYNDYALSDKQTTLYTGSDATPWSVGGSAFTSGGLVLTNGQTVKVLAAVQGNAAIRCNVDYFVKISATSNGTTFTTVSSDHTFLATCYPQFIDTVLFDFTNAGTTANFHFRVRLFDDAQRTTLVKSFYSGLDQSNWIFNGSSATSPGFHLTHGQVGMVEFIPDSAGLDPTKTYYMVIDSMDITNATSFVNVSNSYQIRFTNVTDFGCSEYVDVPVVKDIGIMFDLEEYTDEFGKTLRTVLLNI